MKISPLKLILSFLVVIIVCSALSMSSVAENYRWTLVAMNPWNGVEGMAFTVSYFLHLGKTPSLFIALGILIILWWRMYLLINRLANHFKSN